MNTTTLQLADPAASCTRYCGKHPQERVVGVCSACLANKLSSLIYTSTAFAPDHFHVCSPLSNSPLGSINSPSNHHHPHRDHLHTISEEADSIPQEINEEGLLGSILGASFTPVEACTEVELAGNHSVYSNTIEEQILSYDVVPAIGEENPTVNQDISMISDVVSSSHEEVRIMSLEEGKPKANPYLRANKPIKCKRSKSLSGEQSNATKKVTLRTLFQLDDEEKWRTRALMAADASVYKLGMHGFSADYKPLEEVFDRGLTCNAKQIEEAKDVHDNLTHNSHKCVPSASTLSSSVCPSMPSKLKHSVLLNSLLCRKTGDGKKGSGSTRKPCQVKEASRTTSLKSLHDDGGFTRATYIASESREALRRCRSKLERSVARSLLVSSPPTPPPCISHIIDMKSERKFNLTARVLATSVLHSSADMAEAMLIDPPRTENSCGSATQIEELEEGQDLMLVTHNDPARLQWPREEAKPAVPLAARPWEEHNLGHTISNAAQEGGSRKATEEGPFLTNREAQDDEQVERAEMAADTKVMIPFITRANVEMAQEERYLQDAAQEKAVECQRNDITATEASQEVTMAVGGCGSHSCSSTSGKTIATEGQHKLAEGGVWEAYSNKSGRGVRKWAAGTGKITPAQSGLLRFYLAPLRASGRTSTRRPKRHFWSLVSI